MPRPRSGPESRPDGHFVQCFPPTIDALPGARHEFARWLASWGMDQDLSGELAITFSELTTNAVSTTVDASLCVDVRAWCEGMLLTLEVVNPAPDSRRSTPRWDRLDELRSGGRGLQIVEAFVDSVDADHDDAGRLVVRCRRSINGHV